MTTYDFDEIVPRRGTDCMKHDRVNWVCSNPNAIPLWVADMDFRTPPFVMDVIRKRVEQGILGYTCSTDAYRQSICRWNLSHYGYEVAPEAVNYVPGVVSGIFLALQVFTQPGDRILIQEPVYHPFRLVPEACGRQVVQSSLVRTDDTFRMDFDRLRRDIQGCRMMILCNPHNPAGICWDRETLQQVAHIAREAGVLVISDEIHCDMCLGGRTHIPFASVSDEARENSITLQAPTKTFNLPGIVSAIALVPNEALRMRYFSYIEGSDQDLGNVFAYDCVQACYSEAGDEWCRQMLDYVQGNIDFLADFLATHCPRIVAIRPQASYLVFLDARELHLSQPDLQDFFATEAGLALNSGTTFGPSGEGYMRLNVGCPRSVLQQAMKQLQEAYARKGF